MHRIRCLTASAMGGFKIIKCVESKLCSEVAKMLMNELSKHRCFDNAPK